MTSQAAQDLEDDEHTTNLEKLTFTIASGHANTSSPRNVSKATWTYLTSRGGVLDGSVIHRRPHDHDHDHVHGTTKRVGALAFITLDGSSPQCVPARTPTVHWGRYDERPRVARHAQRAKRLTMTHQKNTTNEMCFDGNRRSDPRR